MRASWTGLCALFAVIVYAAAAPGQAPHVISTSPAQNELAVPVSSSISVTFDVDMDSATINSSTFVVNASSTGLHLGAYSYDEPTRTMILSPDDDFDVGEMVTVVLTTGIASWDGIPLAGSHSWSFTVTVHGGFGNFAPQILYPAPDHPSGIIAADLNDDGYTDLATSNRNAHSISVFINPGTGAFTQRMDYATGQSPRSIVAADLDADGNIDLATVNGASQDASVLLNDGDGSFSFHSDYQVGVNPQSLHAADLNGDGCIDLSVANMGTYLTPGSSVSVLLNSGDGTFAQHVTCPLDVMPVSVFGADLDGDGDIDLATANPESHDVSVLLNDGFGSFSLDSIYPTDYTPNGIRAADIDDDGDLDLAVSNGNFANRVSILLNTGDGDFVPYCSYPVGDYEYGEQPFCISVADLDEDGDLDLVTGNVTSSDVSVLLNNSYGGFPSYFKFPAGYGVYSVVVSDLDSDGDLDLAAANYGSSDVSVLFNHFIYGDASGDGTVDIDDVVYLITHIFSGGPAPDPSEAGDADCSGDVDIDDVVYLIAYIFSGGNAPCDPDGDEVPDC